MRIAVLMTCHNRRERTVQSLQALAETAASAAELTYHVYLVDDGSSDGTAEEVKALRMPVTILSGSGDLYWNRGMHRAWSTALASDATYEAFLLLNDDTVLDNDALERLIDTARPLERRAIVVGAVRDGATRALTYGGVRRLSQWHPGRVVTLPERDETQKADTFNGNCVLVPAIVCDAIGILDPTFQHGIGDFDYGYRARQQARSSPSPSSPTSYAECTISEPITTPRHRGRTQRGHPRSPGRDANDHDHRQAAPPLYAATALPHPPTRQHPHRARYHTPPPVV